MKYFVASIEIILITILINNFSKAQEPPTKVSEVLNGKPVEIIHGPALGKILAGKWVQGNTIIPSPRYYAGSVTYTRNDTAWLYIFGGDTTGYGDAVRTCSRYNINTNTWELIAELPAPARLNGAAILGDKLYSFGGFSSKENIPTGSIYEYDVNLDTWTQLQNMPDALYYLKGVGFQDSVLYLIGGAKYSNDSNYSIIRRDVRYTNLLFPSNTYTLADSIPYGLADGGLALANNIIYYIGGFVNGANTTAVTFKGVVDSIDRSKITWIDTTNYKGGPIARINAHGWGPGKIIIGGGSNSGFNSTSKVYIYDALNSTYTAGDTVPIPITAYQSGTVYTAAPGMEIRKYVITGGITSGFALTGQTWLYTDTTIVTELEDSQIKPDDFLLFQNYPNPFNPVTNFEFRITKFPESGTGGLVSLKIFDVLGKEIATIVNEELPAGNYSRQWNAEGLSSGIYFYRLSVSNFTQTKKLLLMK